MADEQPRSDGPPGVSVIMPAYDEADGITAALEHATGALGALCHDGTLSSYEILVIDDGSTDGTGAQVRSAGSSHPEVRLLTHDRNRGVGAALRSGIAAAHQDLVLYTDADMPVDLAEIRRALPHLHGDRVAMVVGHRTSFDREGPARQFASRAYDRLARLFFAVDQPDVNFPFKLLGTDLARHVDLRSEGALVDIELLAKVQAGGASVVSIPMTYTARTAGESKTIRIRLLGRLAIEVVRHYRSIRPRRTSH